MCDGLQMVKLPLSPVCFLLSRCESYGEMPGPIWQPVRRLGIYDVYARDRHSYQVRVLYVILGFFFCKVAGKNPWSQFFGLILKDMVAC